MKLLQSIVLFLLLPLLSAAQGQEQLLRKEKIKKLDVMVGEWVATRKFMPYKKPVLEQTGEMSCYYLLDSTCIQCRLQFNTRSGKSEYLQTTRFVTDSMQYETLWLYSDYSMKIVSSGTYSDSGRVLTQLIRLTLPGGQSELIRERTRFVSADEIYFETASDLNPGKRFIKDYECVFRRIK